MDQLINLANFIVDHTFSIQVPINLLFFSLILLLFLAGLLRVVIKAFQTWRHINKANSYLSGITLDNIDARYVDMREKFLKDNFYKNLWREFDETLRKINDGFSTRYYNTAEASHFLNSDTLFYQRFSSGFYFVIPTTLTGLGILGTFIGLVFGLQFFEGVDFANTESVAVASEGLLSGIAASFITSVWGLLFSLSLSLILSKIKSNTEYLVKHFTDKLEALFPRNISAEGEGLFEIKKELEKHTTALETFSTKLANSVSSALEEGINKSLSPVIEKMANVMEKFSMEKSENVTHTLSNLVNEFKESLTGAAQSEIQNLNSTLDTITSSLDKSNETFSLMLSKWQDNIHDQSALSDNQKDFINVINENLSKLDNSSFKITEITNQQKDVLNDFNDVIKNVDHIKSILAPLDLSLEKANSASEKYVESARLFDNSSENFKNAISLNNSLIENQRLTISELVPVAGELRKIILDIQNPLSEISNSISGLHDIETVKLETYDKVNHMTDNLNLLFNTISDYESKIQSVVQEFSSTSVNARQIWSEYKSSFETIQREINDGVVKYTDVMRQKSSELFMGYDEALSSGLKNISTSIMDLVESFDSLEDKLDQLAGEAEENV